MQKTFDEQKQQVPSQLSRRLSSSGRIVMVAAFFSFHAFVATDLYATDSNNAMSLSQTEATQQVRKISGTVYDVNREAVIGASVMEKGTTNGAITDLNGNFSFNVTAQESTLEISFVGYRTVTLRAKVNQPVVVTLQEDSELLDEVVVVGYGTQKRVTMTSAVASVKGETLAALPSPRLSNNIGGMVSGVITFQESGAPGQDGAKMFVRGSEPLILVDGVERPGDRVNMADVESISVLKDAAAVAPYGLKGANGVILITTKRGTEGKMSVTYSGEVSWQKPMNTPSFLGSADYYEFRNKAYDMDGLDGLKMPQDEIDKYRLGTDEYPDTDWIGNYMKTSTATKHNVSVSGGTDKLRGFASLGYVKQGSMFGAQDYERYNMRVNVDFQATQTTKISFDNSLVKDYLRRTGLGAGSIMEYLYRAVPNEVDVYSNGLPAYQNSLGVSLNQSMKNRGRYTELNDITTNTITIHQEMPFLKGLSGKVSFNYDKQSKDMKDWVTPVVYYKLTDTGEYEEIDEMAQGIRSPQLSQEYKRWDWYTFNGSLSYDNSFGKHHVNALALFEARWSKNTITTTGKTVYDFMIPELNMGTSDKDKWNMGGTTYRESQYGIVGRVGYNFDEKYMVELAARFDETYKYAPGRRDDFFPSVSVGWRISEEPFMAPTRDVIDNFKLRASYGKSGNPVGDAFAYMSFYNLGTSYLWGKGNNSREQGIYLDKEANPLLTWETVWKTDFGFDLNLWKGLLGIEFDYYYEKRSDKILEPNAEVPYEYGIGLAKDNAGKDERWGIDLTLINTAVIKRDLRLSNALVFAYTNHQDIEKRENQGTLYNPRRRQTGLASGQIWGYKSAGLFKDEEEIKNWAYQADGTKPGDIKYMDINGDGKIDSEDVVHIGRSTIPQIMWGYNLKVEWKGFDLGLFFQGTGRSNYYLGSADRGVRRPFADGKARKDHLKAWSTDNPNPNAKYPRLRSDNFAMNYVTSDFWVINSSYVKLKSIDLGYSLKREWISKVGMSALRVNANFYNVWTIFSKASKDFDPEAQKFTAYPQQFISTLGLTATF